MIVDGRQMAGDILKTLLKKRAKIKKPVSLGIILVGSNPASLSFIKEKQRAAQKLGISYCLYQFNFGVSTKQLQQKIKKLLKKHSAWIVQLPLPKHLKTQEILDLIPAQKDADMLSTQGWSQFLMGGKILPPAVGVVKIIFKYYRVKVEGRRVVVVGFGRLVGQPVAFWLALQKAKVSIVNEDERNPGRILKKADIIVSGVGKANLIKGRDVKKGAVIIDFGFNKKAGKLRRRDQGGIIGDVDFKSVSKKAKLITPVPGGTGPLTVVMLIKNVILLAK